METALAWSDVFHFHEMGTQSPVKNHWPRDSGADQSHSGLVSVKVDDVVALGAGASSAPLGRSTSVHASRLRRSVK